MQYLFPSLAIPSAARRVPNWRLATSASTSTWAATWTSTWPVPPSTQLLCWATRAGWLATSWLLTLPNLNCPRTTLPWGTRPVTSSFIPMCESLHHSEERQEMEVILWMRAAVEGRSISPVWSIKLRLISTDAHLHLFVFVFLNLSNDGTEFAGSIYQKVNGNLETAVHLAWTAGSNNTRFGIGAKYQLDKDASLSVRTDRKASQTHLMNCVTASWFPIS